MVGTFSSTHSSELDLHRAVQAMGVTILVGASRKTATGTPPYAVPLGSPEQPMLELTMKSRQKFTVQLLNRRQGKVIVRGNLSTLDAHIERLLTFFGPCVDLTSNTPVAAAAPPPAASGALCDPRALLQNA